MFLSRKIAVLAMSAMMAAACGDAPTGADRAAGDAGASMHHVISSITGPNPVNCSGFHTYDSNPGGGSAYTYNWSYRPHGDTNWYSLGTSRTATQWIDVADTTMTFRVDVTSSGHTSTSYKTITGPYWTQAIC